MLISNPLKKLQKEDVTENLVFDPFYIHFVKRQNRLPYQTSAFMYKRKDIN
jgi:hypothetical protein